MNMNKEYRTELRALRKAEAKVQRDTKKENRRLHMEKKRYMASWDRASRGVEQRFQKAVTVIDRRIAILEGRLS